MLTIIETKKNKQRVTKTDKRYILIIYTAKNNQKKSRIKSKMFDSQTIPKGSTQMEPFLIENLIVGIDKKRQKNRNNNHSTMIQ